MVFLTEALSLDAWISRRAFQLVLVRIRLTGRGPETCSVYQICSEARPEHALQNLLSFST